MTQIDVPAVCKPKYVCVCVCGLCVSCVSVGSGKRLPSRLPPLQHALLPLLFDLPLTGVWSLPLTQPTQTTLLLLLLLPYDRPTDLTDPQPPNTHHHPNPTEPNPNREQDIHKLVYASAHIGTKNSDKLMEEYIWRRRSDCESSPRPTDSDLTIAWIERGVLVLCSGSTD
jgi:hypothetical protein